MRTIKVCILLLPLLCIWGCWKNEQVQEMAYVTSIGVEHKDGKFITYMQVINFVNVAKSETMNIESPSPIWVGKGEGITLVEAFRDIYKTSQLTVYWGHVRSVILHESILEHGPWISEVYNTLNRYREVRYNIYLFGTKEKLEEVLNQKSLLLGSPINSIMDQPQSTYIQQSNIRPQLSFKLVAKIYEDGWVTYVPSLKINQKNWKEDDKNASLLEIDGAYLLNKNKYDGWHSLQDLLGSIWLEKKMESKVIVIPNHEERKAIIDITKVKPKIVPVVKEEQLYFDIFVTAEANLVNLYENTDVPAIEKMSEKVIEEQIQSTFDQGARKNIDVYSLFGHLYSNHYKMWKKYKQQGQLVLREDMLNEVNVKVNLIHTGKYKNRTENIVK